MKTKIAVVALIAAVFFAGCSGKREQTGLTLKPGVLMIGMNLGYPPMEYLGEDGVTPAGFSVEMGKIVAERLGLQPEFINTAWQGIFDGLNANRWDVIISSVTVTPERILAHNFSKPYIANTLAMVARKDSSITARNPREAGGLDVAFQGGTTADFFMERLAAEEGLRYNPYRYANMPTAFTDLELGRVHTIVTDILVAYDYISIPDSPFEIIWQSEGDDPEIFAATLKLGNDALTAAIDRVIEEMFNDGTMLRLSYEIFGEGMDFVTAARQTW
ncbi:MAG: transporter substrate-binding domain-containing protein [Treponema sp.]|nr:transporter substrate-binding domain-containing protein [Treponema sp.]